MSIVIDIANAVAASLSEYGAKVYFVPEFDLKGTKDAKVIVIPAGTEYRSLSRGTSEERPCIHVGILKRAAEDDIPSLINFAQGIGASFVNRRFNDAICTSVVFDPIYSPSHLRDKGLFVSVMELTFRAGGI